MCNFLTAHTFTAKLNIERFPRENIRRYIEIGEGNEILYRNLSVFTGVPVEVPGFRQSEIVVPVEISETNVINPHRILENVDITFAGNSVTFSEKNSYRHPNSVLVPYRHVDRFGKVQFLWKIGHSIVYPGVIIDTGSAGQNFGVFAV